MDKHVWIKVTSHRARHDVRSHAKDDTCYISLRKPGEWYQIPTDALRYVQHIKGATICKREPTDIYKAWK